MKKLFLAVLLITLVSHVSVYAEPWSQFIRRAETMVYNVNEGINRGNHNTWGIDKWGALLATYDWLEIAYSDIFNKAPNLTSEQRRIYGDIYRRRVQLNRDLKELCRIVHGRNSNTIDRIMVRFEYWWDYLDEGGIITFN